eukprot:9099344-Alexandrium_andersonii.AAC.1
MSASLVGSEMCIRDRLKRNGVDVSDTEAGYKLRATSLLSHQRIELLGVCLLYTSDAADDM